MITKPDTGMVHHESHNPNPNPNLNPFILEPKRSKVKATRHKNIAGVGHGALVCTGFF